MKLLCMTFDGDIQIEHDEFETLEEVWEHSDSIGSKWFFYPFHFAVTDSGRTIKDANEWLNFLIGCRVRTVRRLFATLQEQVAGQDLDVEDFVVLLNNHSSQSKKKRWEVSYEKALPSEDQEILDAASNHEPGCECATCITAHKITH